MQLRCKNRAAALLLAGALAILGGCNSNNPQGQNETSAPPAAEMPKDVYVVTHESFSLPEELVQKFNQETGLKLHLEAKGHAGAVLNQLVLTKDNPIADAVFGVDNSSAQLALKEGVVADVSELKTQLPENVVKLSPDIKKLVPMDQGDVCINVDKKWFEGKGLEAPRNLEDLTSWKYQGMLTVPNPASSSPGFAFMLATIAKYGEDGWLGYWEKLKKNEVKVASGWSEAYNQFYTAGEGKGKYPIVLSYSTSPSASIDKETGKPTTASLPDTCYRQVEYAGVLKGAKNPAGAAKFIDWMLSKEVQEKIASEMWVYPVTAEAQGITKELKFDDLTPTPLWVDPATVGDKREAWLKEFTAKVLG